MSDELNNSSPASEEEVYEGILGDYEENETAAESPEETAEEKPVKEKKHGNKKVLPIVCICAAVLAVGGLGTFGVLKYREMMPKTVAFSDHAKITDRMASCYIQDIVDMYVSYYGEEGMLTYYGLDVNQPLKDQSSPFGEDQSWFDYLLGSVQNNMTQYLVFKEAGLELGYKLTDRDRKTIDDKMAQTDLSKYPANVTEADLRAAVELQAFGAGVYSMVYNGLEFTDEEIDAYMDVNGNQYLTCGLMGFSVQVTEDVTGDAEDETTPEDETAAGEETAADGETSPEEETAGMDDATARSLATSLKNSKSAEQFEDKVAEILTEYEGYTDEQLETLLPSITNDAFGYSAGSELADWAFGGEAKAGDTLMIEGEGVYYVYYMTREPGRDESPTINVRHILFNIDDHLSVPAASATEDDRAAALEECRSLAADALAQFQNGTADEDSFAALANELSEDPGSNTNGGLYKNVMNGQMVTSFNDWCFDASRKHGDTGTIESDYGVHVMFFSGSGDPAWKANAISAMRDEKFDLWYQEQESLYTVTVDEERLKTIEE